MNSTQFTKLKNFNSDSGSEPISTFVTGILALEDKFEYLYDVDLESGKYELFVNEQTSFDSINLQHLSYTDFFGDSQKNIPEVVYPEDRETVETVLNKAYIVEQLKNTNIVEYRSRVLVEGRPVWIRTRITYKDKEHRNIIVGIFNIEDEVAKTQKDYELRKELINQMLGGESIYLVNPKSDEFSVIYRNRYLTENYSSDTRFSNSFRKYVYSDVYEADREKMSEVINIFLFAKKLVLEKEYEETYRDISTGAPLWYRMRAIKISESEIVMGFSNVDKEFLDKAIHRRIEEEFFAMFAVDFELQTLKVLKNIPYARIANVGESLPYRDAMMQLAGRYEGETKQFFEELCDINAAQKELSKEGRVSYNYKAGEKWITVDCIVLSKDEEGRVLSYALGFRYTDYLIAEREELQKSLSASRVVVEALSEDFGCVNYINLLGNRENDIDISYRVSDKLKRLIPGWEKETSYSNKIRRLCDNVVYYPDRAQFEKDLKRENVIERLKETDVYYTNFRALVDGEIVYYQIKVSAVRECGILSGIVVGIHSVDDSVRKEMAIQEQLKEAVAAAEAANSAKTAFLNNMSHDIRTPMNAIMGFTSMAKRHKNEPEKLDDCLEKIQESGNVLLSLINSVLEVSRIESGNAILDEQFGDVMLSFTGIESTMRELAETKDVKLDFELGNITDRFIMVDIPRCTRIFVNVISNAIKYTPEGGKVKVSCEQTGEAKNGVATYKYTVSDNGIGMSEAFQEHLFDQFARERNATISGIEGTGLGMAVVKSFVGLMNGEITCKSKQGEGTTITITLPFKVQNGKRYTDPFTGEVCTSFRKKEIASKVEFKGERVLVVEDNEINMEIASSILKEEGLTVEEAENGEVAVNLLKEKGPQYYDIILMDIQMPVMNGYEATQAIRDMYPEAHIPIIALSANAFVEDKIASLEARMDGHISKPIVLHELLATLQKFLNND